MHTTSSTYTSPETPTCEVPSNGVVEISLLPICTGETSIYTRSSYPEVTAVSRNSFVYYTKLIELALEMYVLRQTNSRYIPNLTCICIKAVQYTPKTYLLSMCN